MKKLIFYPLTLLILFCYFIGHAQELQVDPNTLIKDEAGNRVEQIKMRKLIMTGDWTLDPVKDKEGELLYMQLRKITEEEKAMMLKRMELREPSEKVGKKAPNFNIQTLDGKTLTSKNTKGKIVVLNFWFTSCMPCIKEIPELNEVYESYKNNPDVVFASITFDSKSDVNTFLEKHPISYPVVTDSRSTCRLFEIKGYPTNIIIDRDGNYADLVEGGFPHIDHYILNKIAKALKTK
ncbi:TlpA disulfide reductase family protein [Flammeovirgaceae bacterium SG7u.111]|nr:TlpA disulfide reductase family protein [Flammeovirgaceae bacterium SG7u.132]WPO36659.1 TlpA disulfide reductase family protein [Flammeovirgaceae bacterium SG7u.111]